MRSAWNKAVIVVMVVFAGFVVWRFIVPEFSNDDDITAKHVDSSTPFVEDQAKILSEDTDQKIAAFNEKLEAEHDGGADLSCHGSRSARQ